MKKNLSILLAAVLLLSAMLACGSSSDTGSSSDSGPVTLSELPLFDGATQSSDGGLQAGMQAMIDNLPLKNTQGVTFDMPADTTWDAVKSFYSSALGNNGWTAGEGDDANTIQTWSRGNQAVVIHLIDNGLILVLGDTQ